MPKGGDRWPVIPVFMKQEIDIPFGFSVYGLEFDASGGSAEVRAAFDGAEKFTAPIDLTGVPFLPAADLFDEIGDWSAIIKFDDGANTFYSEQFYFRVMKAGGF